MPLKWIFRLQQRFVPGFRPDRVPLLGKALRAVLSLFRARTAVVQGHRMVLDPQDSLLLSVREVYEPTETAFFSRNLRPGHVVVDVGANIGYYTLLFARAVGPGGRVFAFEPEPGNFELLRTNVELNGYANVVVENAAVSTSSGALELYVNEQNRGDHQAYDGGEGRTRIQVRSIAIDEYLAGRAERVDFIKMDIQGWEPAALGGMAATLRSNPDIVLVTELWPKGIQAAGFAVRDYVRALQELGFSLFHSDELTGSITPADIDHILREHEVARGTATNLVACRAPERLSWR